MDGPDPFAVSSGVGDYGPPPGMPASVAFQLDPSIQQDIGASFGPPNPAGPSLGVATDLGPMPTANELGLVPGPADAAQALAGQPAPQAAPEHIIPLPSQGKPGEMPVVDQETPGEIRDDAERAVAKQQAADRVHQEAIDNDAKAAALRDADWGTHQASLQKRQNDYDAHVADLQKSGTVDSEQWWQSRSAGQQFAAIFAAAAAGFLQGTKGGSNTAIDSMQKAIDNNIQAQQSTIANKRAAIGLEQGGIENERQLALENYNHAEAQRQAAWAGVEAKAQAAMGSVDPRGTQFEQARKIAIAAQQKQQEAFFNMRQKNTEFAVAEHTMTNQDAATAISRGHLGLARQQAKDTHEEHIGATADRTLKMGYEPDPTTGRPMPDGAGGFKRVPAAPNALPSKAESEAREAAAKADAEERNNGGVGDVFYADGTRVRAQNPEDAKETATQREGLDAYSTMVGRMEQIRKKYNGVTGRIVNSDEYRQLKSEYATTILNELKAGGFTRPTETLEKLLGDKAGGLSPTDWRDSTAGMREGLAGSITSFNAHLQKYNQDGKTVKKYTPPEFKAEVGKGFTPDEDLGVLDQPPRPDQRPAKGGAPSLAYVGQQQAAAKELTDNPETTPDQYAAAIKSVVKLMHEGHLPPAEGAALVGQLTAGQSHRAQQDDVAAQYEPGGRGAMGLK